MSNETTPRFDIPTAWRIQREVGDQLDHHDRCSSVPGSNSGMGGPVWLCDCDAVRDYWERMPEIDR